MKRVIILFGTVLLLLAVRLEGGMITPEELALRRDWAAARFDHRQPPPETNAALVVHTNHGPVLKNARAAKPLRIGGQDFARGLLTHAPSRITVRLPGPGDTFSARVGIDSNEQTSGGGAVLFFPRRSSARRSSL
jgi:hypothetical protein